MTNKPTGGPAFHVSGNLDVRDYFAAVAMQARVSLNFCDTPEQTAARAYEIADAMMVARRG